MISELEHPPIDHGGPVDRPFEPFPASALQGSIVDRFVATAQRFSSRLAVSDCAGGRLTYEQLAIMVDRIAVATDAATAGRPGPVAILLPSGLNFPAAMFGVLASGRGFVPLDAANPDERNRLIAARSGAAAVVSAGALADRVRTLFPHDLPIIDVDRVGDVTGPRPIARSTADDLAFIIYTSGSTGTPKGAYHNHRNVLHDAMQQTNTLHLDATDRVALLYSPAVIGAMRETIVTLLNGASLHILPPRQLQPDGLVRAIEERGITICRMAPVLLRRMAEVLRSDQRLASVRVLGLGSQRVDWSDFDVFRRCCSPEAFLIVNIASTECGGHYGHWFVDQRLRVAGGRLPIGRIPPDASVTIEDDHGRPVAPGETGELVVASRYIGLGYWRDPELTARAFKADPADSSIRIFRTGDLGRMRPDGLLEYVGRADQQIKLRGHRIELGEIEFALAGCAGIEEAAVVARQNQDGLVQSLAAYVELRAAIGELRPRDLRSMLSKRLPQYMIPATINMIDRLPRLPNLKIDRARLAQMDAARLAHMVVPIDDPLIAELIKTFESVLGAIRATPEDNISSLGGDSLQVVRVALELERRFDITIPVEVIESNQTIRELARWIAIRRESRRRHPAVADHKREDIFDRNQQRY
jgi:amino acid adenylation domain-containing protein